MLTRYWIEMISDVNAPNQTIFYYGVTAYNYEDALQLLQEKFFQVQVMPSVSSSIENIDVSKLDKNKLTHNIGTPIFRGVWYPILKCADQRVRLVIR